MDDSSHESDLQSVYEYRRPPGRIITRDLSPKTAPNSSASPSLRPPSPANSSARLQERVRDRQLDSLGLTVLHEPRGFPVADLVFLHGFGGGSWQTWCDTTTNDSFWPRDWLPFEPNLGSARILTFGYNSHLATNDTDALFGVVDIAKDLLARLKFGAGRESRPLDIGQCPLIFIGHSLGGLIAKKAYILGQSESNSAYAEIARSVAAFVFLSTPHRLISAQVLSDILSACVTGLAPSHHTPRIQNHVQGLHIINEQFRDLLPFVEVFSFYERQQTALDSHSRTLILRPEQATLDHPSETPIPLDADHLSITRYKSSTSTSYRSIRDVLRHLVDKIKPGRPVASVEDAEEQGRKINSFLLKPQLPEDDLAFFSDKRVYGSCEWIVEDEIVRDFLGAQYSRPAILWAFGLPGSGKSVTSSFIIDHLTETDTPTAYYFFRSGNQVKNSLSLFMTSIASQLGSVIPEYRRKLCALCDEGFEVSKAPYKLLWKKLFCSTLLKCEVAQPFYIVVDGLDEVGQAKELLQKMFVELAGGRVPLRLILVSRSTPDIELSMKALARKIPVERLTLDRNTGDLEMYVKEEMADMTGSEAFKSNIQREVLTKANGNFLWAHLVVHEIMNCHTETQVMQAVRQVPKELEPLYQRMDIQLADAFRSRPDDMAMGHAILMWTTCSRYPLHLSELEGALHPQFAGIMDIKLTAQKLCREFITLDKKDHITMMHSSTREFLLTNPQLNYYVDPQKAHQTLFRKCLQAIRDNKNAHDPTLPAASVRMSSERAQTLLTYAASSWPFHLTRSSGYQDQDSLSALMEVFQREAVVDWMYALAKARNLRAMVEAAKALTGFLRIVDHADSVRSPLTHRLEDKSYLATWSQDLVRIVAKFGAHMKQHPKAIYDLIPAFCPQDSILYRQFAEPQLSLPVTLRGKRHPGWDDCLAKFAVAGDQLPHRIATLDRHFAVLTKDSGTVRLYYATTCEEARSFNHGEIVTAFCVDSASSSLATYGLRKTKLWDLDSGAQSISITNPRNTKALAIGFRRDSSDDTTLITFSEDQIIRVCSPESIRAEWVPFGQSLSNEVSRLQQVNAPRTAEFSVDGLYLAVAYRGAHPLVWYLEGEEPEFLAQCDHRSFSPANGSRVSVNAVDAQAFAWNPLTGHLLGTYNDGCVFKWHPTDGDYTLADSTIRCTNIRCSYDGKLFVTGSGDGTMRIWDFDHFTPIYQLRYPLPIQDLDIGRNDARVYDLRDQYCNVWEPNALLRALESDERASDAQSSKDSSLISRTSEAIQEDFEPITAFAVQADASVFASGNDVGAISISDFDGVELAQVDGDYQMMSVEHLAWSKTTKILASIDLGREITVRSFGTALQEKTGPSEGRVLQRFNEDEQVTQLLFDTEGLRLLVATVNGPRIFELDGSHKPRVPDVESSARWLQHPFDQRRVLGLASDHLTIVAWDEARPVIRLQYNFPDDTKHRSPAMPMLQLDARRPSQAYPTNPAEIEAIVTKALVSHDGKLILVEVFGLTRQSKRRADCILIDTNRIETYRNSTSIPVASLSTAIAKHLHVSIGFIAPNSSLLAAKRRPSAQMGLGARRLSSQQQADQRTFVFVDHDFWVCTAAIGGSHPAGIRRHFFLPRDWQNTEWLEKAEVTNEGDFLCPRNGDIGVVSNGFLAEWTD